MILQIILRVVDSLALKYKNPKSRITKLATKKDIIIDPVSNVFIF